MQTFLPYEDFRHSAKVLDRMRLGKQRVEAKQIYNAIHDPDNGWRNHPAVKMWVGHEPHLLAYGLVVCEEWRGRGYKDSLLWFFEDRLHHYHGEVVAPPWLGSRRFHSSHRAALLYKDVDWYSQFGWTEFPEIKYWWPTKEKE
jgi:hypothetical protein